ncbi:hypothetical protein HMPREF9135_0558 [Segatella baroniae F0067]|uniref:Uncharacterized protein n=1 Tax=Segatella baroniae F0067 TaxID=1115809 RepID=U2P9G4_9BACT|nr:hypothetical protein HMPREF9135_0558 [Segatella baroniae F0067]
MALAVQEKCLKPVVYARLRRRRPSPVFKSSAAALRKLPFDLLKAVLRACESCSFAASKGSFRLSVAALLPLGRAVPSFCVNIYLK